jgi:toxin-antitoxin system PIN domain toxin
MIYLLDVNVLIALIDPAHVHHDHAHRWFDAIGRHAWASCPLTQNSVLRIVSHPRYNPAGTPAVVAQVLQDLLALSGHTFWPDDISLMDPHRIDATYLLTSNQVTDTYLLALAVAHQGQLATFDRRLVVDAVHNGRQSLHRIS